MSNTTNQLFQVYQERIKTIGIEVLEKRQYVPFKWKLNISKSKVFALVGFAFLLFWIYLSLSNNNFLLKEVLSSSIIIGTLLWVKAAGD